MSNPVNNNPFAGLFSTVDEAESFSSQHQILPDESNSSEIDSNISKESLFEQRVQKLIAEVFGITMQQEIKFEYDKPLVYIKSDSLEQAIFERLMETDLKSKLVNNKNSRDYNLDKKVVENRVIIYLFESFIRLKPYRVDSDLSTYVEDFFQIIFWNVGTALLEPKIYEDQEVCYSHSSFHIIKSILFINIFPKGLSTSVSSSNTEFLNRFHLDTT